MASNLRRTDDVQRIKARELWLQNADGTYPNDGTILYMRSDGLVQTNSGVYVPASGDLAVPGTLTATHVVAVDVSATTVTAINIIADDISTNTLAVNQILLTGLCAGLQGTPLGDPISLQPDGGYVGVGTCNPQYTLDVSGTIHTDSLISTDISASLINVDLVVANTVQVMNAIENVEVTQTSKTIKLWAGEAAVGRVNTAVPVAAGFSLDVSGNEKISGYMNVGSVRVNNAGVPGHTLDVNGGVAAADYLYVDSSISGWGTTIDNGNILTRNDLTVLNNANIRGSTSINKATAPAYPLDVSGAIRADSLLIEPPATALVKMKLPLANSTQKLVSIDTATNQISYQPITVTATPPVRYVACGKGAPGEPTLQWSTDGLTWYPATSGWFTERGFNAAYGNGLWVAVGGNTPLTPLSSIKVSTDGKNWTNITSGGFAGGVGYKVAWNGSLWVASGDSATILNTIQWSTDGFNWNNILSGGFNSASPTSGGYGLVWTGSSWIAAGFDSTPTDTIQRSVDGKNWVSSTSGGFIPGGGGIASNGTLHIAVGGSSNFIQYSTNNAVDWTAVVGAPQTPADVAYNGIRWIALGGDGSGTTTNTIYTSTTGTSGWVPITSGGFNNAPSAGGRAVIWDGAKWIATGVITGSDTKTTILWSTDGLNWQSTTSGGFSLLGEGLAYAPISVTVAGNLTVAGNFSAVTKAFKIPHPVRPNTTLYHIAIEGPRADLIYRGRATLSNGRATVSIDAESTAKGNGMTVGTFEALAANPQVFVSNNESWDRVRGSVAGGILTIECESASASATVDWMVVAERKDASMRVSDITDADGFLIPEHPASYLPR
jgi:hypothetical protein